MAFGLFLLFQLSNYRVQRHDLSVLHPARLLFKKTFHISSTDPDGLGHSVADISFIVAYSRAIPYGFFRDLCYNTK